MRIAVVGTGVSGLVAASRLHPDHELVIYEAADRVGGHARTVDVTEPDGRTLPVDTGFIVYNEKTYPEFTRLLAELGVQTRATTMSFSVRCDETGLEYNGESLRTLFAQKSNLLRPSYWRMLRDISRFYREGERQVRSLPPETTVREFADRFGYGEGFLRRHLLPLGAAIWSSPAGTFERFPVRFVVDFLARHDMLELDLAKRVVWRTVLGGSREYVTRLSEPFRARIRTSYPVRTVERREGGVLLTGADGATERFDHVVLACHSDQALALLADPSPAEREVLGAIPYERNHATLHTDPAVLPRRERVRAAWNYRIRPAGERPTLTYGMNILQGLDAQERWCVSINEEDAVDPTRVVDRIDFEHPVYTTPREQAQGRRGEIQGVRRTTYCGAYWGNGFHEDGVVSGLEAARVVREAADAHGERVA